MAREPVWIAATAATAPVVKHIQDPDAYGPLCQDRRREWAWVDSFTYPHVFDPCSTCLALWEARNA